MTNLFALNCEYEVTRGEEKIEFFDRYAQKIVTRGSSGYESELLDYNVKITEQDLSNYNHKMWMLYVSDYEADRSYNRDIVVAENINQQVIFDENFKKVRFLFLHVDANKEIDIHFNVIDKTFYKIAILVNQKDEEDKENVSPNLSSEEFKELTDNNNKLNKSQSKVKTNLIYSLDETKEE